MDVSRSIVSDFVCVCVCAYVRACVCAYVCVCVSDIMTHNLGTSNTINILPVLYQDTVRLRIS